MFKVIYLLKRKPGISHEEFRERYESHSELAKLHVGHLMVAYERKYPTEVWGHSTGGAQPPEFGFDCIAEWTLESRAGLEELYRIAGDPAVGKAFFDDEEGFLDRGAMVAINVDDADILNTGTGR